MPTDKLIRIGVLGTEGDKPYTSHIYAQWAPLMNPIGGMARKTGMVITHVWDKDRGEAEKFARIYGVPNIVDRYDAMAGLVDGVVQSGYKASFWAADLVKPYLEAKVPVYIDRPGAYSLGQARRLVETAARHDCLLIVSNNHENSAVVELLEDRARQMGSLTALLADSLTDREMRLFSMHCIHGWYMIYPILAGKVRRARTFLDPGSYPSPVTIMECRNSDGSPFIATLMRQRYVHRGYVKLFSATGSYEGTVLPPVTYRQERPLGRQQLVRDTERWREHLLTVFSLPAMARFEKMMVTRKMPQTYQQIVEKIQVFLAMDKSLREGGVAVEVSTLDPAWTSPNPYPGYFPDGYFPRS